MENKKYGLVLAGGGAKGAYQIGAFQALKELGILENIIAFSGNSIGTVNMALLIGSDLDTAKRLWENMNVDDFLDIDEKPLDGTNSDGIFSREGINRHLKENIDFNKMSNCDKPCYITVSTTPDSGEMVAEYKKINGMDPDEIRKLVIASSAIPVMYGSVNVAGGKYMDGGFVDNTPIKPLYDAGIKDIIVISNNSAYQPETQLFKDANLYTIIPSKSLDMDTLIGTVDFDKEHVSYRMKLGYMDAKMQMLSYLAGASVISDKIKEANHNLAMQEMNRNKLESSVNSNMQGLAKLLGDL